jgi:hypothetical protein
MKGKKLMAIFSRSSSPMNLTGLFVYAMKHYQEPLANISHHSSQSFVGADFWRIKS